jgi:hypothetical protein
LLFCPPLLSAQTEVGVDLGLFSSYVWRGLTITNKPVLQPAAYLSLPAGTASVTVGVWSNVDLGRYDDLGDDISESGGSSGFNLAELEPYVEVSFPVGRATLTGGIMGYVFPNAADAPNGFGLMTSESNTVEAGVSYSLAAGERLSVDLGATAGFNAGRGRSDDPTSDERANYSDDGFTHLDLSAGVPVTAGSLSITPALHVVINGDDRTKITSPIDRNTDAKLWGGVSLSWSRALGSQSDTSNEGG